MNSINCKCGELIIFQDIECECGNTIKWSEVEKAVIRKFLEKQNTEQLTDKMRHRIETWIKQLEGEE